MHHIRIIKVDFSHVKYISYINQLTLPDNYPEEYYIYHMYIENNRKNYCAKINNIICGYILVKEFSTYEEIVSFAVLREYRRMNVGRILMEKVIGAYNKNKKLYLYSYTVNMIANNFYKKMGFKELSRIKNFYGKGYDGIKFVYGE